MARWEQWGGGGGAKTTGFLDYRSSAGMANGDGSTGMVVFTGGIWRGMAKWLDMLFTQLFYGLLGLLFFAHIFKPLWFPDESTVLSQKRDHLPLTRPCPSSATLLRWRTYHFCL